MNWIQSIVSWMLPRRRPDDFVYVNQDGSVRELSQDESAYVSETFHPADGARPYIKRKQSSKDGWGSLSGFLLRRKVPQGVLIERCNPAYKAENIDFHQEMIDESKRVGDIITTNPDGSVTVTPNPSLANGKRFELLRDIQLQRQRDRENFARCPEE